MPRKPIRAAFLAWGLVGCIALTGCSRRALSVLLDVPEPEPVEETGDAPPADAATPVEGIAFFPPEDTIRPEIEALLDPDTVVALLPRDAAGNIDWMAALHDEVIDPRPHLPGEEPWPRTQDSFQFAFDFYFPGPDSTLKAYFPHSSHTQWLDCRQCHPRIFPYRGTEFGMTDIFQGKYCAECHGKVAFPVMTDCERCHVNLPMPPNRATPDLLGTVTMRRVTRAPAADAPDAGSDAGAAAVAGGSDANPDTVPPPPERSFLTASLPPARFPHWVHRIRYRCKACHMELFEPRAGANVVTMADIEGGRYCGRCHDGVVAFAAGFGACQRCHVADDGTDG